MADARIEVEIAASLENFGRDLNTAIGSVNFFESSIVGSSRKIQLAFANINRSTGDPIAAFTNIGTAASRSGVGIGNLSVSAVRSGQALAQNAAASNRAGFALLNLGRVAQDLPYGFMGIQNNLNPLLESFQALRRESGSNALALKALASSLMGGAGIGLALSVVTAAISFATMGMTYWKARTGSAKKATEEYIDTLSNLDKAHVKGGQNAQKEVVQLDLLYRATQNTNLSLQERKKAVDKLQEQYPAYFKNIKDEKILTGQAKESYDKLKDSLLATGRARAAADASAEIAAKELESSFKINKAKEEREALEKKLAALSSKLQEDSKNNSLAITDAQRESIQIQGELIKKRGELIKLEKESNDLVKKREDLMNAVGGIVEKEGVKVIVDDKGGAGQKLKTVSDILKDLALDLQKIDNNITLAFGDIPKKKIGEIQKAVEALQDIGLSPASETIKGLQQQIVSLSQEPLKVKTVGITQATQELDAFSAKVEEVAIKMPGYLTDWQKALQDFSINASHIVTQGSVDIVAGFSEMLAGMATGQLTLQDLAAGLFGILGDIATQLGKAAIAIGVGMIAIKASFANPATAIAAGAALVALGSLIKQAASIPQNGGKSGDSGYSISYVPKFAKGGIVSGPTMAMVGEYPGASSDPEVISPLSKLKSMIRDTSAGSTQVMIPELRISGQDMLVVFRRAERADKRGT